MKRIALASLVVLALIATAVPASAHCQIPCGIYDDELRVQLIEEHIGTVEKSMNKIMEISKASPVDYNQLVRWVNTKEEHATKTQHIIAQYFMSQRLKPTMENYVPKLVAAHAVMRAAMKCKQTTEAKDAAALKEAILAFHKAYAGKKK